MSALFQNFYGTGMAKRLLRYCLTKQELLDESTMDLENLDLTFGRNSVLEFRDVGIRLKVSLAREPRTPIFARSHRGRLEREWKVDIRFTRNSRPC